MGHIGGFTPLELLFIDMGRGKKSESARKKRDRLVKDVAEEVRALQGAERRMDTERKMAARAGPRLIVTFNPGNSPPPTDSDEEALEANFGAGQPLSKQCPPFPVESFRLETPGKRPFRHHALHCTFPYGFAMPFVEWVLR